MAKRPANRRNSHVLCAYSLGSPTPPRPSRAYRASTGWVATPPRSVPTPIPAPEPRSVRAVATHGSTPPMSLDPFSYGVFSVFACLEGLLRRRRAADGSSGASGVRDGSGVRVPSVPFSVFGVSDRDLFVGRLAGASAPRSSRWRPAGAPVGGLSPERREELGRVGVRGSDTSAASPGEGQGGLRPLHAGAVSATGADSGSPARSVCGEGRREEAVRLGEAVGEYARTVPLGGAGVEAEGVRSGD